MSVALKSGLTTAGEVSIQDLSIISANGTYLSLLDYLVEFNLYESIYNNVMSGDVVISDSRNLISNLPITGEELLVVKFITPSMEESQGISKTFRVYKTEDRRIIRDTNTQLYVLKFVSQEAFLDSLQPLFNPFDGTPSDIITTIFSKHLKLDRTYSIDYSSETITQSNINSDFTVLNKSKNKVSFISPGWTPLQVINWLTKKSIPQNGKACTYLFWETNKGFFLGTVETLLSIPDIVGTYRYSAYTTLANAPNNPGGEGDTYNVAEKMSLIDNLEVIEDVDQLTNTNNGYFASSVIDINLYNKKYNNVEYNHLEQFKKYTHAETNIVPLFNESVAIGNKYKHIKLNPRYPKLFNKAEKNISEVLPEIYGNRISNIRDLTNLRLNITINGRTDIEAGRKILIEFPDVSPPSEDDSTRKHIDPRYSGQYLITSIHHKITGGGTDRHSMIMEVVRDGTTKPNQVNK